MDFSLSDEQQALLETADKWARANFGSAHAREVLDGKRAPIEDVWPALADFGWLAIIVPEELGGSGGTVLDGCLIVQGLSRHLGSSVPFAGNALVAAAALVHLGADATRGEALERLSNGEQRYSVALDRRFAWPPGGESGMAWEWDEDATLLVPNPDGAVAPASSARVSAHRTQDLLRPMGAVESFGTEVGAVDPASDGSRRFLATAFMAVAADLLGTMEAALQLSVEHAASREQFGKPIGTFQAVQHMCAEMLVDTEASRSAVYGAAWAADHLPAEQAFVAAATAKSWCAEASRRVAEHAVQVHGGMGFTWECNAHLHLRAAHLGAAAFADQDTVLGIVADALTGTPLTA